MKGNWLMLGLLVIVVGACQQPGDTASTSDQQDVAKTARVSNIIGMDVQNPEGANLGEIEDLVLDFDTGQIAYVAVSAGGITEIGEVLRAVPWGALHLSDKREVFILDVNKVPWENAMTIDQNDWPEGDKEFRQQLKSHYMAGNVQRDQETSPLKSKAQASQAQSDPSGSAEPSTVAETSEQPEAQGSTDADGDGVADVSDKCPKTIEGAKVDEKGCAQIEQPLARLEDVLFESGKATLRPRAEETLTELVSILENNPDIRVRLEGYTDNVGNKSDNEVLSQKRAESIKDYLVSEGIDAARIKTIGMGERNPIATNETEQDRAQNRRVDIMRARADTQGTFAAREPLLLMVPVEFKMDPQAKGCWVEMYSKDNFEGDILKLVGPLDMATMRGPFGSDWENEVESIKTGPKATITIYDNENFVERSEWVGPSKEIENLDGRMGLFDSFRSMKVDC